jgi:hypothetical protein
VIGTSSRAAVFPRLSAFDLDRHPAGLVVAGLLGEADARPDGDTGVFTSP